MIIKKLIRIINKMNNCGLEDKIENFNSIPFKPVKPIFKLMPNIGLIIIFLSYAFAFIICFLCSATAYASGKTIAGNNIDNFKYSRNIKHIKHIEIKSEGHKGSISATYLSFNSLKKNIIRSFFMSIPSGYKNYVKYMQISNFRLSINNLNKINSIIKNKHNFYIVRYNFYDQGFAGMHTAVIKIINKKNGKLIDMFYADFNTAITAPVVVASRPVGKFQILGKNDLMIKKINISNIYAGYNFSVNKTAGKEAAVFISENMPITKINSERKRIINFGNIVSIVYKKYGINIKMRGIALQAGAYGQIIRVKNLESGSIISGIVKTDSSVIVK
ncbi:MAG: flagellar basal body P-ring formation protein FlgA [Candidatus Acididesulfobacter guangdongensis]|uniref:Flagellar basal body P-ring formation protein FlgA n=1 Tax=Acididesulfobacter guangdongensis TaxID=2597225 RepID=A0A519BG02_ACIG2|nr:MAG: flagellar basal body P-ring formation protein FlgA [Candidatus Acididesulfobacter guangdongensis]